MHDHPARTRPPLARARANRFTGPVIFSAASIPSGPRRSSPVPVTLCLPQTPPPTSYRGSETKMCLCPTPPRCPPHPEGDACLTLSSPDCGCGGSPRPGEGRPGGCGGARGCVEAPVRACPPTPPTLTSPNGFSVLHSPVKLFSQYVTPTSFTCSHACASRSRNSVSIISIIASKGCQAGVRNDGRSGSEAWRIEPLSVVCFQLVGRRLGTHLVVIVEP